MWNCHCASLLHLTQLKWLFAAPESFFHMDMHMLLLLLLLLQDCSSKGVRGRLGNVLRSYLNAYLPDDAHKLCEGTAFFAVTRGECNSLGKRLHSLQPTAECCNLASSGSKTIKLSAVLAFWHVCICDDSLFHSMHVA
jgi:hypothetical protein